MILPVTKTYFIKELKSKKNLRTEDANAWRHVKCESEASQIINHEVYFGNPPSLTDTEEDGTDDTEATRETDVNIVTPSMILPALCLSISVNDTQYSDPPTLTDAEDSDAEDSFVEDSERLPALCLYKTINNNSTLYGDPPTLTDIEDSNAEDSDDEIDAEDELEYCIPVFQHIGLRGGHAGKNHGANIENNLRLSNTNNDCFVNSVLQLLSASDYATFLRTDAANILVGTPPQSYTMTKLLSSLYSTEIREHISTATIRSHVALMSGKSYLDQGTQQDSEEFLCALEETLSEELTAVQEFRHLRSNHWGEKQTRRLFRDNSKDGSCSTCGLYPSITEEPFFILQLNIPHCASSISLASVIQSHFSESPNVDKIRCPHCCPHDGEGQRCTHQGICRGKEAAELCLLKKAPTFLFLQLLRFDGTVNKVLTHVKFDSELVLPNTFVYEPVAVLNHSGLTSSAGHYVTYRKLDNGQWMLFDDTHNRQSSLQEANTADNYILLFKKKDTSGESVHLPCSVGDDSILTSSPDELPTLCQFIYKETDSLKEYEFHVNSGMDIIQDQYVEKKGNKRTQFVFVGDDDMTRIEDKTEEGCKILDDPSETLPVMGQTNYENYQMESKKHILDKQCRGCGKIMERLLRHLRSKKWELCMTEYQEEELIMHTLALTKTKHSNYREKHNEKIKEKKREYREKNNEKIRESGEQYRDKNPEKTRESKEQYREKNKEKIKDKNKSYYKTRDNMTLDESITAFKAEIIWGAIYACISCHRTCFRNGVKKANIEKLSQHSVWQTAINPSVIKESSCSETSGLVPNFFIKNSFWICNTCFKYISWNSLPKKSSENSLQVYNYPDCLKLTEVENVLIAPRINFIKMIKLPSSRMLGIRDRIVNVPITSKTICQTVESLPRTLEEAQVIPISLRKQKSMVSSHFQQYINPGKIRQAVMFLIGKYPFYEDVMFNLHKVDNIFERLKDDIEEDIEEVQLVNVSDTLVEEDNEEIESEDKDIQYIKEDPVRKHQTDTSNSSFLLPENIEAKVKTKLRNKNEKNALILAPGEDQIPRNILKEKHPFVLHFPCLFPDGKGGLHDTRQKKLTTQEWVNQRLLNKNLVFSKNKPFVFSAVNYVEQQQLMSRMNISYLRGKVTMSNEGTKFLQTEDGYAVFDGLPGSPRYWQKMKFDLIAKMEQLGPPQFFYTLSCANKRWEENSATILAKTRPDLKIMHSQEETGNEERLNIRKDNQKEYEEEDENEEFEDEILIPQQKQNKYFVHENFPFNNLEEQFKCKIHKTCSRKPLKEYLDKKDEHELQSEHVLDVTRNFDNRIRSFRKNILRATASPMKVRYYHDRVEFQARYVIDLVHTFLVVIHLYNTKNEL